jgi:hypothetical protein
MWLTKPDWRRLKRQSVIQITLQVVEMAYDVVGVGFAKLPDALDNCGGSLGGRGV